MQADYKKIRKKLNIAMGQLSGVSKMVEDDKYCIDISVQILAVISALKGINNDILEAHFKSCVVNAVESNNADLINEKIDEVMKIITKLSR